MMTAEQFWPTWDVQRHRHGNYSVDYWLQFAEAYTAAQLAEKEREIEQLTNTNCCGDAHMELNAAMHMLETLGFRKETQADGHTHVWRNLRAEAAEQRLQEAQAESAKHRLIATDWKLCSDNWKENYDTVVERLRQREAELEQRDADILRYVEAVREWRGVMMHAWAQDHHAVMTALLEAARPEWPMPVIPSPPKEPKKDIYVGTKCGKTLKI